MLQRKLIIAGALLLCASQPAHADKVFAHSKSLNMSFTALGDPWCGPDVNMQVTATDAARFETPDYNTIIQKLGHVLTQECPEASTLAITGVMNDATVWTGSATKSGGWVAQKATTEPPAVAAADASGAAESTAAATESAAVPEPVPETAKAAPAAAATPAAAKPAVAETPVAAEEPAPEPVMEIAGWKPGGPTTVSGSAAGSMKEINAQDSSLPQAPGHGQPVLRRAAAAVQVPEWFLGGRLQPAKRFPQTGRVCLRRRATTAGALR